MTRLFLFILILNFNVPNIYSQDFINEKGVLLKYEDRVVFFSDNSESKFNFGNIKSVIGFELQYSGPVFEILKGAKKVNVKINYLDTKNGLKSKVMKIYHQPVRVRYVINTLNFKSDTCDLGFYWRNTEYFFRYFCNSNKYSIIAIDNVSK